VVVWEKGLQNDELPQTVVVAVWFVKIVVAEPTVGQEVVIGVVLDPEGQRVQVPEGQRVQVPQPVAIVIVLKISDVLVTVAQVGDVGHVVGHVVGQLVLCVVVTVVVVGGKKISVVVVTVLGEHEDGNVGHEDGNVGHEDGSVGHE